MRDLELQLHDHRLTTIEVIYYLPDHPSLLQSYIWQTLDVAPTYPRLTRFLDHWRQHIQATIHSIKLCSADMIQAAELRHVRERLYLN